MKKGIIFSLVLLIFAACGSEHTLVEIEREVDVAAPILLKNVKVVDPKSGAISDVTNVLIKDGVIADISESLPAGDGIQTIDATGKYVVPGFIDMHLHVFNKPDPTHNFKLLLANGITGFREMAGSEELLKKRANGTLPAFEDEPTVLAMPGELLMPNNGTNVEEASELVKTEKEQGADFIKIAFVEPDVFFAALAQGRKSNIRVLGHVPAPVDMTMASDSGFITIEHLGMGLGGLVVASPEKDQLLSEAPTVPGFLKYVPGFAAGLAHGIIEKKLINPMKGFSEEEYERMQKIISTYDETLSVQAAQVYVKNGTWQVPTFIRLKTSMLAFLDEHKNNPNLKYIEPEELEAWQEVTNDYEESLTDEEKEFLIQVYQKELALVKLYDEQGVKMLTGSDAVTAGWIVPGFSLHQEFKELADAGISPLNILRMATINAAEYLQMEQEIGTVEKGKKANLVLLNKNPLESVENMGAIGGVMINGHYSSEDDISVMLKDLEY
ncbi:amidohydrolase family protein [Fulvivirga ligni]|uniref:amidohydrolase family protein n=1 Tax=Fulvivirga ligni TaxID=2904246 RepID=UPI001F43180B|nr:amidohydrolase family protein [Fulvivirga ligni]UII19652.1 amidohydrolase family protein [Fulvivirga ligni]